MINRIPFTLPDVGLREVKGMVYMEEEYLVLNFQNALFGVVDVEKDIIKIEPAALAELAIDKGVFRDKLVIAPKKTELLNLVPGTHPIDVRLRVWRKYRSDLRRLIRDFRTISA